MSKFLIYVSKDKDATRVGGTDSVRAAMQESAPLEMGMKTFSYDGIQVACSGKVSVHLDESQGLLFILTGYFRRAGASVTYSDDAKNLQPLFDELNEPLKSDFEGCFSLVVCHLPSLTVSLVTDRFGTHPLYYSLDQRHVAVSSGKYLLFPWLDELSVPSRALTDTFWLGFTRAPESMISGIAKVKDNCLLKITGDGAEETCLKRCPLVMKPEEDLDFDSTVSSIEAALEDEFVTLGKKVERVAVLLSGGVDSSILAAYASKHFADCVAFSCEIEGFDNPELKRAQYVAEKLGLKHHVVRLNLDDLGGIFSEVVVMLEGPSRHINNIVVRRIFQEIRGFDAIIGGDGADALFGTRTNRTIVNIEKKIKRIDRIPALLKSCIAMLLRGVGFRKHKHLEKILTNDIEYLISNLFTIDYTEQEIAVARKLGASTFSDIPLGTYQSSGLVGKSIEANFSLFLRAMLERNTRLSYDTDIPIYYPFLTESMFEVSRRLPYTHRFDKAENAKPALREICRRMIDSSVIEWPKIGFETPEKTWMTHQLKSYLDRVLMNEGEIAKVLDCQLSSDDVAVVEASNRIIWWLITLDASLRDAVTQAGKWKHHRALAGSGKGQRLQEQIVE
ncbi:asparagine synthase-related protein [Marinobacter halophilus]|uniref:asparagine synthase (glutamine-hydrolyzing) n=1 Tax=Marinobacter halophilus TaxID=1323740 RepID=A0A2T1K8W1_9GAMM|nr:asparagine synthase-related protein [Marinobacter halophilus]PSF06480.1 hypothetical protein C7H08_15340 [Marinobacter halophilus]GGC72958.1 asparagine synthetase B [Marinobacter halophilus]